MANIQWRDFDLVHKQLASAREDAMGMYRVNGYCPFVGRLNECAFESPIEAVFAIWMEFMHIYAQKTISHAFTELPQRTITLDGERFRPDFIVVPLDPILAALGDVVGAPMKIAVELDGHEFHERTKEQVTVRDRRDRVLQRHGWIVLHISGSELVRGPQIDAIADVWRCGRTQLKRLREAVAKEWGAPLVYDEKALAF